MSLPDEPNVFRGFEFLENDQLKPGEVRQPSPRVVEGSKETLAFLSGLMAALTRFAVSAAAAADPDGARATPGDSPADETHDLLRSFAPPTRLERAVIETTAGVGGLLGRNLAFHRFVHDISVGVQAAALQCSPEQLALLCLCRHRGVPDAATFARLAGETGVRADLLAELLADPRLFPEEGQVGG